MFRFQRPTGSAADVNELEYISALHQTGKNIRSNASISANDVVHFLSSRYGIKVTREEVKTTILKGLGGGDDDEECIDLTEVMAILLIPHLLKARMKQKKEKKNLPESSSPSSPSFSSSKEDQCDAIFEDVVRIILHDVTGSTQPKKLDTDLVKQILCQYGEEDISNDNNLVNRMVEAATENDASEVMLDKESFAHALTDDVKAWNINKENAITTNYYDVFRTHYSTSDEGQQAKAPTFEEELRGRPEDDDVLIDDDNDLERCITYSDIEDEPDEDEADEEDDKSRPVKKVSTIPSIDYAVDTYRSKVFTILLWAFFVLTHFTYLPTPQSANDYFGCDPKKFACKIGNRTINWIIVGIFLSIGGSTFILIGSLGNSIYSTSKLALLSSIVAMLSINVGMFTGSMQSEENEDVDTDSFDAVEVNTDDAFRFRNNGTQHNFLRIVTFILGILVVTLQIIQLIQMQRASGGSRFESIFTVLERSETFATFLTFGNVVNESNLKKAATFKIDKMVQNALALHDPIEDLDGKSYSRALLNYGRRGEQQEEVGGFLWTWKTIFSKKILTEEGIWLQSRLFVGNIAQLVLTIFIVTFASVFTSTFDPRECEWCRFTEEEKEELNSAVRDAAIVGGIFSFLTCLTLTLLYIPSAAATVLRFRCGLIPSLRNPAFYGKFRLAPDTASMILGSMFFGVLWSGLGIFSFFGLITFLISYEHTRNWSFDVLAQIVGFMFTAMLRILLLVFLRRNFYAGMYRTDAARGNVLVLILECWNIALAAGYMLGRALKLGLVAFFYMGRIDIPLFEDGVGQIGPVVLDDYPTIFRRDLVAHDAHRHPFLERIGVMYMMKLRHGERFAKTSGSCWRMIFVFALMPWLRRYRVLMRENYNEEEEDYIAAKGSDEIRNEGDDNLDSEVSRVDRGQDTFMMSPSEQSVRMLLEETDRLKKRIEFLSSSRDISPGGRGCSDAENDAPVHSSENLSENDVTNEVHDSSGLRDFVDDKSRQGEEGKGPQAENSSKVTNKDENVSNQYTKNQLVYKTLENMGYDEELILRTTEVFFEKEDFDVEEMVKWIENNDGAKV